MKKILQVFYAWYKENLVTSAKYMPRPSAGGAVGKLGFRLCVRRVFRHAASITFREARSGARWTGEYRLRIFTTVVFQYLWSFVFLAIRDGRGLVEFPGMRLLVCGTGSQRGFVSNDFF